MAGAASADSLVSHMLISLLRIRNGRANRGMSHSAVRKLEKPIVLITRYASQLDLQGAGEALGDSTANREQRREVESALTPASALNYRDVRAKSRDPRTWRMERGMRYELNVE